ncbi:hypothetical protein D3C87_310250 [compost metagenome]
MEKTGNLKYLRGITTLFLVLYVVFILMNLLESFWYSLDVTHPLKSLLHTFIKQEKKVHGWLDVLDFGARIVFSLLCNQYVKRNSLGKSYHFLVVLLGFLPVFYYFLYFMIWRKLNRSIVTHSGANFTGSDRMIIFMWILILLHTIIPIVYITLIYSVDSPEIVSRLIYWKRFELSGRAVFALIFSIVYLSYFWKFRKAITNREPDLIVKDNQLIDS